MRISDWSSDVCSSDLLEKLAGYWPDIEKSRAEARQLFKKAGVDLSKTYVLNNRGVDQPYKIVRTWLIDQFRQVGLNVEQGGQTTGPRSEEHRVGKESVSRSNDRWSTDS